MACSSFLKVLLQIPRSDYILAVVFVMDARAPEQSDQTFDRTLLTAVLVRKPLRSFHQAPDDCCTSAHEVGVEFFLSFEKRKMQTPISMQSGHSIL